MDVLTRKQRSYCMSRNRGRDTGPELLLRRELWRRGLRYRLESRIFGRPDLVFKGSKIAVFVDGCFWHGCPQHAVQPKKNSGFWSEKMRKNRNRDALVVRTLTADGWTVLRIWEHDIRNSLEIWVDAIERAVKEHR